MGFFVVAGLLTLVFKTSGMKLLSEIFLEYGERVADLFCVMEY